ncbi:MAG: hypothetical protein HKN26_13870 [Acidimicrobiales bacterium]|nr:hypothetical protein [Acidimicrobiales bacterium]
MNARSATGIDRVPPGRVAAALGVVTFALAAFAHRLLWPNLSGDNDEAVYLFQAELLNDGAVRLPVDETSTFFRPWLSGPHDDAVIFAFQPVWPAFLTAFDTVTGTPFLAPAMAVSVATIAVFFLARRLLGNQTKAVVAAIVFAATPIMIFHAGTVLIYLPMVAAVVWGAVLVLRAVEQPTAGRWAMAGVVGGFAFLLRPFDALLFLGPFVGWAVWQQRTSPHRLARSLAWAALGTLPSLVATAALNNHITGSPFTYPTSVYGGANRFGFGLRAVAAETEIWEYRWDDAFDAQASNVAAVSTWAFGAGLGLVLAAVALWRRRGEGGVRVLAVTAVAFPVGYLFWWGSVLSAQDPAVGVGPHYLLPCFVALAVLGADPLVDAVRYSRPAGVMLAIVAVGLTVWTLVPKVEHARDYAAATDGWDDHLSQPLDRPAIVFVDDGDDTNDGPYVMHPVGTLRNDPTATGDLLYAADLGPRNPDVLEVRSGRSLYRIESTRTPDAGLFDTVVRTRELAIVRGDEVAFEVSVAAGPAGPNRTFTVEVDGTRFDAPPGFAPADAPTVVSVVVSAGPVAAATFDDGKVAVTLPDAGELRIETSLRSGPEIVEAYQYRQHWRTVDGEVEALVPGRYYRWWNIGESKWLRWETADRFQVAAGVRE